MYPVKLAKDQLAKGHRSTKCHPVTICNSYPKRRRQCNT